MTANGHNGHNHPSGTNGFTKVDKPGIAEPIEERARLCAIETWCTLLEGHPNACVVMPRTYGPPIPPPGWYLTLPPPRTWCSYCATPAVIVRDGGGERLAPHGDGCAGENTDAKTHPRFRG